LRPFTDTCNLSTIEVYANFDFNLFFLISRQVQCKSNRRNVNENVSRRMEYMSELRIDDYEPTLSLNDVWLLLRPYFGWFIGAVVVSFSETCTRTIIFLISECHMRCIA
jgi:hypothetical protein